MNLHHLFFKIFLLIFATLASSFTYSQTSCFDVMKGFPADEPGISLGVSACFAGVITNNMIIAGGCNFPELPVAKGGKKRFYKGIYIAALNNSNQLHWSKIGELPQTLAYGLTIVDSNKLILVGGSNENGSQSAVYCLTFNDRILAQIDTLPSLPFTLDNMGGVLLRNTIYVVGGNVNSKPSNLAYTLDLSDLESGWRKGISFPGPARIQPVVVAQNDKIYLWGGFAPSVNGSIPTVSTDGYMFSIHSKTWSPLNSPISKNQESVSLGGGVGIALDDYLILCTGGVNKDIFVKALNAGLKYNARKLARVNTKYLTHKPKWYQFNSNIFIYNTKTNSWTYFDENELMARAGASLLKTNDYLYLINGEIKPGIRTSEVTRINISCFYK